MNKEIANKIEKQRLSDFKIYLKCKDFTTIKKVKKTCNCTDDINENQKIGL